MMHKEAIYKLKEMIIEMDLRLWERYKEPLNLAINALKAQESTDLISKQAAIDAIVDCTVYENADDLKEAVMQENAWNKWSGGVLEALEAVEELPSAQPERKRGKWLEPKNEQLMCNGGNVGSGEVICSVCGGTDADIGASYCWHCGAEMTESRDGF